MENRFSGLKNDTVGPGQYDQAQHAKALKAVKWHQPHQKAKKVVDLMTQKQGTKPGPGHYEPESGVTK